MTRQERHDLIEKCLSIRRDIDLDRAYGLASMAVHDQFPDHTFTEEDWDVWTDYRVIVLEYQIENGDSA